MHDKLIEQILKERNARLRAEFGRSVERITTRHRPRIEGVWQDHEAEDICGFSKVRDWASPKEES